MTVSLNKRPALERFDNKIFFRRQRLVWICTTALWPALVEVSVEPQAELSAKIEENIFEFLIL